MNPKIAKLKAEHKKNEAKITALQARNKEIESTITELENLDIIGSARECGMSPETLVELLMNLKDNPVSATNRDGAPAKPQGFVGRGGATEAADSGRLRQEELNEVRDDETEDTDEN